MSDTRATSSWNEKIIALPIAEVVNDDTLRFERYLDAPPASVWQLITSREGWHWTHGMTADLRVGGAFELHFDETQSMHGRITALEPERKIEMDWVEASIDEPGAAPRLHSQSILCIELEPAGAGTQLTLTHRHVTREDAPGLGAGWHAHLGQLEAALAGDHIQSRDIYEALLPRYEQLIRARM